MLLQRIEDKSLRQPCLPHVKLGVEQRIGAARTLGQGSSRSQQGQSQSCHRSGRRDHFFSPQPRPASLSKETLSEWPQLWLGAGPPLGQLSVLLADPASLLQLLCLPCVGPSVQPGPLPDRPWALTLAMPVSPPTSSLVCLELG